MPDVSMYTMSTCPWCRKAKNFFKQHDVPFEFIDYDLADEATQKRIMVDLDAHGATGFPGAVMTIESRKRALHTFFAKVVDRLGYKFTPDEELRDFLLEQEVLLERKHGIPFCPQNTSG